MKTWSSVIVVSILTWAVISVQNVSAESGATPKNDPIVKQNPETQQKDPVTKRLDSLTRRLGLSTEQQAEIKLILLDESIKLKENHNAKMTPDEKKLNL